MVPVDLENPSSISIAIAARSRFSVPISFSAVFSKSTPEAGLRELLQQDLPVELEVQTSISDESLEGLEEFLTRATSELEVKSSILLGEWNFDISGIGIRLNDGFSQSPPASSWLGYADFKIDEQPNLSCVPDADSCAFPFPVCVYQVPTSSMGYRHTIN